MMKNEYSRLKDHETSAFDLEEKRIRYWQFLAAYPYEQLDASPEKNTELASTIRAMFEVERFWAYPGYGVMNQLHSYLATNQLALFKQLSLNTTKQLESQAYRRQLFIPFKTNLDLLDQPQTSNSGDLPVNDRRESANKTYFEVLIIHPNPIDYELTYRNSLSVFKTERDEFIYDILFVSNAEDALVAVLANPSIQVCVYLYGYPLRGQSNAFSHEYEKLVSQQIDINQLINEPLTGLKNSLQILRPELDHYLISETPLAEINLSIRERFHRILYHIEPFQELHHTILSGIRDRYSTPFFDALRSYSKKPKGVFHALPLSRGQSLKDSHWIRDMLHFYGSNIFLAETSSTQGGMDSLLDPKGAIKQAHYKASQTFRSQETYFVTNGTSTSNKIVMQANLVPGDIVLTSADCHKSIPYAIMLSGAYPLFLETYPLNSFDLYGAVPLKRIKSVLLDLRKNGKLHHVKQITLTNSTFDGLVYNTEKYMMDILAIKPDIIFHWDEAWYAYAYFNPLYERRTAMSVANGLGRSLYSREYREEYNAWYKQHGDVLNSDTTESHKRLINMPLMPSPDQVKLRVYATQSTHKTLTSFRQGSMLHIYDDVFNKDLFLESYRMHTSTSPNYQIIASLDAGRRQVSLEGYERVKRAIRLAMKLRREISRTPILKQYFTVLNDKDLIPTEYRNRKNALPSIPQEDTFRYNDISEYWGNADFIVDPTRVTVDISKTKMDGTVFRELLINKYDIQVNKTSRKTVLFIVNIGATDSTIDFLISVLSEIANRLAQKSPTQEQNTLQAVESSSEQIVNLPMRRHYHNAFIPYNGEYYATVDMRAAYYAAFNEKNIEFIALDNDILKQVMDDRKLVSAAFITPYPPGFPIVVPGQIITHDTLLYLQKMRIKEIHGYKPEDGLKVFNDEFLESLTR